MKVGTSIYAVVLLSLLVRVSLTVHAQFENIWAFGEYAGLDFNNPGPPVPFQTAFKADEASASVCDADGDLLFYTDGVAIYNRNHSVMPNGTGLTPPGWNNARSSRQGALIVPFPGDTTKYYVFSTTSVSINNIYNTTIFSRLYYSVVDMRLNGGLGDVVPGEKAVFLDADLAETITAIIGDRCNIWLITYSQTQEQFKNYSIGPGGIDLNPVLSPMNYGRASATVFSSDRKIIAHSHMSGSITLADFNATTGVVSNPHLEIPYRANGLCFSPDNTKLYASEPGLVYQYDLMAGGAQDIINSKIFLAGTNFSADLKLGPDGKLYFASPSPYFLSVIDQPNLSGLASQPQSGVLSLLPPMAMALGLPNVVPAFKRDTILTAATENSCNEPVLLAPKDTSGWDYSWQDGREAPTRTVTKSGTYWVRYYSAPCVFRTDTFKVEIVEPAFHAMTQVICSDATYRFGDTVLQAPGLYYDTLEAASGCDSVVKLDLIVVPAPEIALSLPAGSLCIGDSVRLTASGTDRYAWFYEEQLAGEGAEFTVHLNGAENVIRLRGVSSNECVIDTLLGLHAVPCCDLFVPNAFSPNGDGINDVFKPESTGHLYNYRLEIFNRWGQRLFTSTRMDKGWPGEFGGQPLESGTYYYYISADCYGGGVVNRKGDLTLVR